MFSGRVYLIYRPAGPGRTRRRICLCLDMGLRLGSLARRAEPRAAPLQAVRRYAGPLGGACAVGSLNAAAS